MCVYKRSGVVVSEEKYETYYWVKYNGVSMVACEVRQPNDTSWLIPGRERPVNSNDVEVLDRNYLVNPMHLINEKKRVDEDIAFLKSLGETTVDKGDSTIIVYFYDKLSDDQYKRMKDGWECEKGNDEEYCFTYYLD
jgi:hypothetical protein